MKLHFCTQDYENYGTENEPYWKAKGGSDYIIEASEWTEEMVNEVINRISYSNPFSQSSYIGHDSVSDEYMTEFERAQLDYDGEIIFPATRLNYDEFVKEYA